MVTKSKRLDGLGPGIAIRCPMGHGLPNYTARGQCTEAWCALDPIEGTPRKLKPLRADSALVAAAVESVADNAADAGIAQKKRLRAAMQLAMYNRKTRLSMVAQPSVEEAKAPEAWFDKRVSELLPDALAEVEYQLRYGDDQMRKAAALDIWDANGKRKKEALNATGQTLVLNLAPGQTLPWLQKAETAPGAEASLATPMLLVPPASEAADDQVDPGEAPAGQAKTVHARGDGPRGVHQTLVRGAPAARAEETEPDST